MSGFLKLVLGDGEGRDGSEAENHSMVVSEVPADSSPTLAPEEVRELRLKRLGGTTSSVLETNAADLLRTTSDTPMPDANSTDDGADALPRASTAPARLSSPVDPVDSLLRRIFHFTLTGPSTSSIHHLAAVEKEMLECGASTPVLLSETNLAEALWARLSTDPEDLQSRSGKGPQTVLEYLIACLVRADKAKRIRRGGSANPAVDSALQNVQQLIVSYANTALIEPELFAGSSGSVELLGLLQSREEGVHKMAELLAAEAHKNDCMEMVVDPIVAVVREKAVAAAESSAPFVSSASDLATFASSSKYVAARIAAIIDKEEAEAEGGSWNEVRRSLKPGHVLPPAMANNPLALVMRQVAFSTSQAGARVERESLLGILMRPSAAMQSVGDAHFKDATLGYRGLLSTMRALQGQTAGLQVSSFDLVKSLIKSGASGRHAVLRWISRTLELNVGLEKMHFDPKETSGHGLLINLCSAMVNLCGPFLDPDTTKLKLINSRFAVVDASFTAAELPAIAITQPNLQTEFDEAEVQPASSYHFVTQTFFYALRSMHLGPVALLGHTFNPRSGLLGMLIRLESMIGGMARVLAMPLAHPARVQYFTIRSRFVAAQTAALQPNILRACVRLAALSSRFVLRLACGDTTSDGGRGNGNNQWCVPSIPLPSPPRAEYANLPEHIVMDVMDLLIGISNAELHIPDSNSLFSDCAPIELLTPIVELMVVLLASKDHLRHAHARAKAAKTLWDVFVPRSLRGGNTKMHDGPSVSESARTTLLQGEMVSYHLVPTLIELFGDVEKTGVFEKVAHRSMIAKFLQHLLAFPSHSATFQRFAAAEDANRFITFANGLLNQTNDQYTNGLEHLGDIAQFERDRDAPDWDSRPESERTQREEVQAEYAQLAPNELALANETIGLLLQFSKDTHFVRAFLLPELSRRLVDMLCRVVDSLTGPASLGLKLKDPSKYNFKPKQTLQHVVEIMLNFDQGANGDAAVKAVGRSQLFNQKVFSKAAEIVGRENILALDKLDQFTHLIQRAAAEATIAAAEDEALGDVPDEFLCPLMAEIMEDPVTLPDGTIVDRINIERHLLNSATNPFTNEELTKEMLIPAEALRARIVSWRSGRKNDE